MGLKNLVTKKDFTSDYCGVEFLADNDTDQENQNQHATS